MKEPKRRQSLSGMVLIMILTIMTVLIVLLTATLSVVSSANQRIYTKYEENQAYYSARSALDVFTVKMLSDKAFYAQDASGAKTYVHGNAVGTDKMTQGLGLQLDMYTIASQDGVNVNQSKLNAYASSITVDANKKDEYKNYFGISDTAPVNEIYYEISMPKVGDNADTYGKFSGTEGTDTNIAKIKVEILERTYNLGTYTGATGPIPDGDEKAFVTKSSSAPSGANYASITDDQIAEAIFNGNRKKDTMRVKITATAMFEGNEGNAVLIYDTDEPPSVNNSRAITSFGGLDHSNHIYIVGGASMRGTIVDSDGDGIPDDSCRNEMSNESGFFGTVYDEVGLYMNTSTGGTPFYMTESEYMFVGGNLEFQNGSTIVGKVADTDILKRPFIFIAGALKAGNHAEIGGTGTVASEKVDVICANGVEMTSAGSFNINGNLIVAGDGEFTSSAGNPNIDGNVYIDGDLYLDNNCATIALAADGVTPVSITTKFDGDSTSTRHCNLYVSGDIYYKGTKFNDKSKVYNSDGTTAIGSFSKNDIKNAMPKMVSAADGTDVYEVYNTDSTNLDFTIDLTSKLPGLTGTIERKIDTRRANYDQYYKKDASNNYVDDDADGIPDPKTAQEISGDNFTDPSFIAAATGGELSLTSQEIDTGGATKRMILRGGSGSGDIVVKGGGILELCLDLPTGGWATSVNINGNGSTNIIVEDDTTLKVYGCAQGVDYTFEKFRIWTRTTYEAYKNNARLDAGSQVGHNIKVPKIYYYFDGGTISTNNKESFLAGYMYAPYSKIYTSGGNITFSDLYYNGQSVPSTWPITFYGSVLCKDFEFQNNDGIVYVNPDLDDSGNAGEPIHAWKSYRYARN